MALLSYTYRSRPGEHYGCTRRATLMWRDSKAPVCWQHARQVSFAGPAVPLDEAAATEAWGKLPQYSPKISPPPSEL